MGMSFSTIVDVLVWFIPLWFTFVSHELSRVYGATYFGDGTSRNRGRLTLNPLKHTDVIGTIIVPVLFWTMRQQVFGWTKQAPVSKKMLSHPSAMVSVALGGILGCIMQAIILLTLEHYAKIYMEYRPQWFDLMVHNGIDMALAYAWIHMIPIPPMDAYYVLEVILPKRIFFYYQKIGYWGLLPIACMLWFGIYDDIKYSFVHHAVDMLTYILRRWIWL